MEEGVGKSRKEVYLYPLAGGLGALSVIDAIGTIALLLWCTMCKVPIVEFIVELVVELTGASLLSSW